MFKNCSPFRVEDYIDGPETAAEYAVARAELEKNTMSTTTDFNLLNFIKSIPSHATSIAINTETYEALLVNGVVDFVTTEGGRPRPSYIRKWIVIDDSVVGHVAIDTLNLQKERASADAANKPYGVDLSEFSAPEDYPVVTSSSDSKGHLKSLTIKLGDDYLVVETGRRLAWPTDHIEPPGAKLYRKIQAPADGSDQDENPVHDEVGQPAETLSISQAKLIGIGILVEQARIGNVDAAIALATLPQTPQIEMKNPWIKGEHWSLTYQSAIAKHDPGLAQRLMEAAKIAG